MALFLICEPENKIFATYCQRRCRVVYRPWSLRDVRRRNKLLSLAKNSSTFRTCRRPNTPARCRLKRALLGAAPLKTQRLRSPRKGSCCRQANHPIPSRSLGESLHSLPARFGRLHTECRFTPPSSSLPPLKPISQPAPSTAYQPEMCICLKCERQPDLSAADALLSDLPPEKLLRRMTQWYFSFFLKYLRGPFVYKDG